MRCSRADAALSFRDGSRLSRDHRPHHRSTATTGRHPGSSRVAAAMSLTPASSVLSLSGLGNLLSFPSRAGASGVYSLLKSFLRTSSRMGPAPNGTQCTALRKAEAAAFKLG